MSKQTKQEQAHKYRQQTHGFHGALEGWVK